MVIDGDEGEELTLTRGVNYTFVANTSAAHPLYITDDSQGAGAGTTYAGGPSSHSGVEFTFTPNSSTPDTVYYQCTNHSRMGWIINIQDP